MRSSPLRAGPVVLVEPDIDHWTAFENLALVAPPSPWLLPPLLRLPHQVRWLTVGRTFLETHREVQGERFLTEASPEPERP